MKEFTVEKPQSLRSFTDNTYPQGSVYLSALLRAKDVRVNGVRVGKDVPLQRGDVVSYYTTKKQEERKLFDVLYEDEQICVADKDSGVNAEAVFSALREGGDCRFIHRIDRNTQGILVFARGDAAERALLAAFRERRVEKKYEAICFGTFPKREDVLTAYLKKDEKRALVTVSAAPIGDKIVTEYRVKETIGELTRIEVILHTGKTHQIRAHLAYIGCPIAGDEKYGDSARNARYHLTRQCLLAKELTLHIPSFKAGETVFRSRRTLAFPN